MIEVEVVGWWNWAETVSIDNVRTVVAQVGDPVRATRAYQELVQRPRQLSLPPPAKRGAG